jgi:hypothetical protein
MYKSHFQYFKAHEYYLLSALHNSNLGVACYSLVYAVGVK